VFGTEETLDMSCLSTRKLMAHSLEQGKQAKRVNIAHRISESSSGLDMHTIAGNISDRTMVGLNAAQISRQWILGSCAPSVIKRHAAWWKTRIGVCLDAGAVHAI
jgi:hypothetical protein